MSIPKFFQVALVGRPNVGKSSLFNALLGYRRTIVLDEPGTTLDLVRERVVWGESALFLIDTMGVESDVYKKDLNKILSHSDAVLFVVDALSGPTPFDKFISEEIRKSKIPTLLVVNKSEAIRSEAAESFAELLIGDSIEVSASHRRGLDELKSWCVALQKKTSPINPSDDIKESISVAIIGRPNVGKSTLMNRFCGTTVSRVSQVPLTTRDAVGFEIKTQSGWVRFVDTAGIRRPRSHKENIEQFSIDASTRAIRTANVVMLVLRCDEPITDQDMRLLSLIDRRGKPAVILLNFWDKLDKKGRRDFLEDSEFFNHLKKFKTVPVSGATGFNVEHALQVASHLAKKAEKRVKTSRLNEVMKKIISANPPPMVGKKTFNILYASQISVRPPTFVFFMNRKQALPSSYQQYLRQALCKNLGFKGQPVRLYFRESNKR